MNKYIKLNEDKSNMEDVVMSYVPAIRRSMINIGVAETEDLMQECLLNIIEVLNKDSYLTQNVLTVINRTIFRYALKDYNLRGFAKGKMDFSIPQMRSILENIEAKNEEVFGTYGGDDPNFLYAFCEQVPYRDYYDDSDIDLETDVINRCYIDSILQCLKPKEQDFIKLYYFDRLTFEEIGKKYNIGRAWAQRYTLYARFKLKKAIYSSYKETQSQNKENVR